MKNNKLFLFFLGIVFLLVVALIIKTGTSKNHLDIQEQNKNVIVNTSFYPLYFFSSQIGGNKANVYNITPAGAEPHDYDPSTQDIIRIEKGNMLVLNGGVESWADKIKNNLAGTNVKIVIAGEELLSEQLTEAGKKMKDFHVWLSPQLAKKEIEKITEGYVLIDPKNKSYFKENQTQINLQLDHLDAEYKKGLSNCKSKNIVTSHAAFAYLADAYGLKQISISGISPDAEPSAQKLAEVATFAKNNNIKYIFFESLVSPKLSETIAHEVGAKTLVLDPIEGISDDNIKQGKNYFTVMRDNLKNLQIALSCTP